MIILKSISTLLISIYLLKSTNGASFSNVYVESENSPVRYYRQGAPYSFSAITSPQLSQIKTLPASAPAFIAPCVTPCTVPEQSIAAGRANVLTYNSPYANVPVVIAPAKEETTGYEYSYVVYDENTGDQKAQRELSDGSVVRGEYSFLQPDGYVREVKYVADDVNGFKAVVKNFLPVTLDSETNKQAKKRNGPKLPCHDVEKEQIREASSEESNRSHEQPHEAEHNLAHSHSTPHGHQIELSHEPEEIETKHNKVNSHEPEHGQEHSVEMENSHESSSETQHVHENSHESQQNHEPAEKHIERSQEVEQVHQSTHNHHYNEPKYSHEQASKKHLTTKYNKSCSELENKSSMESHEEKLTTNTNEKSTEKSSGESSRESQESSKESKESHDKAHPKESSKELHEKHVEKSKEESSEESKEGVNDKHHEKSKENLKKHNKNSKSVSKEESDESEEDSSEKIVVKFEKRKGAHELVAHEHEIVVPYHDVIRCVQAAIKKAQEKPAELREEPSPLTYIILNKPC